MAGKKLDPLKLTIAMPGSMEREHLTHPFRATSPSPGFEYPLKPIPKKTDIDELALTAQSLGKANQSEYQGHTKRQVLREIARVCRQMKSEMKSTTFIEEFYISIYNNQELGMDDRLSEKDPHAFRTYCALLRKDAREIFDIESGEPLSFTSSVWSPKEGRLNVDMHGILKMATGELDIKRRCNVFTTISISLNVSRSLLHSFLFILQGC